MREYSQKISLTKNARGVYSLDPSIGCKSGMQNEIGGCYNDCYAAKSSKLYGYDFSKTVLRFFENEKHRKKTVLAISKIELNFVRMGTSGDPSENWNHTFDIINQIKNCNKEIVIITKHWTNISDDQLEIISGLNICINSSVSALDRPELINNCIQQYQRLKPYCKSVLRVITAKFNLFTSQGTYYSIIQKKLLLNDSIIETVLRVNKNNPILKNGVIQVSKIDFLGKPSLASKNKKTTYFGNCGQCFEQCGLNVKAEKSTKSTKKGVIKQLTLF
jgi:hypothetical protein